MSNESIFDVVLSKTNIIDVIKTYIDVNQKGKNHWAICPFHNDTEPSMSISEEKQIYKCFSCGAGGNSIKFVKDMDSISNIEALKKVADICQLNIDININQKSKPQYNEVQLKLIEINDKAKDFFSLMLKGEKGNNALKYLESRDIDSEIIEEFEIGFASDENTLHKLISSLDYENLQIADSGLFNLHADKFSDFFSNRIMFPIFDHNNNVVAFSGRVYVENDKRAKYANSPESKIFVKSNILYNLSKASKHLIHTNEIIVVEGFMDVIALYKAGIKNVVATMGTAFSKKHIQLLKANTKMINIFMDFDEAGQKSAMIMAKNLVLNGFEVKMVEPIANMDVDDILKNMGVEKLQDLVKSSKPILQFLVDKALADIDPNNIEQVSKFQKFITPIIENYKNKTARDIAINILQKELGISFVKASTTTSNAPPNFNAFVNKAPNNVKWNLRTKYERVLIANLIKSKKAVELYKVKSDLLTDKTRKNIANYIMDHYKEHEEFNADTFLSLIKQKTEILSEFNVIRSKAKEIIYNNEEFKQLIIKMKDKLLKDHLIKEIELEINNDADEIAKAKSLHKKYELKRGK